VLARDVMTRPVVTVRPATPVRAAAALLSERGFTALPVVDDEGRLAGIVTEADLLRGRLRHDARSPLCAEELDGGPPPCAVGEVMTREVVSALPWSDLADVAARMAHEGIRSLPVLDAGELVGIVSRRDLVATLTRADAAIVDEVRRRLGAYAGPGRWTVTALGGMVTLSDEYGDATEQHAARTIAAAVRGVVGVRVGARGTDPGPTAR
jgi:CBS domain-containing protein